MNPYSHGLSSNQSRFKGVTLTLSSAPKWFRFAFITIVSLVALSFVTAGVLFIAGNMNKVTQAGCVVTRTETVYAGQDSAPQKRVYTENCDVMTINDSIIQGSWGTASLYGQLKEGESYDFTTTGHRVPILSMFPNIVNVAPSQ